MLLSVVLALAPDRDLTLPGSLGRAAHAFFLDLIRRADPALAAELHAGDDGPRPFTAAFLEEGAARGLRQTACRAGGRYHLRFTSLDGRLSALLTERVLPDLPAAVRLDTAEVAVVGVHRTAAEHPWAGAVTWAELAGGPLLAKAVPVKLALAFDAPTTFRSHGRHVPLPLPELVFGSLLERWNAFAPVRLEEGLRAWLAEGVAVSRYRLATRLVALGGGKQVGFVGMCEFVALEPDPHWLRQLQALADLAYYSGVGHKTTMGLGRARRVGGNGVVRGPPSGAGRSPQMRLWAARAGGLRGGCRSGTTDA